MFQNNCSAKHHTTLHEYFTSNQRNRNKKARKEDPKQSSNIKGEEDKIQSFTGLTKEPSKRFLMQILPVKVKTTDGRTTRTYALLDSGSQSPLIRDDFAQGLKLKGYKKTVSISSVIDEVEEVKVKEVSLRIQDIKQENKLHISALILPKNMFNMPAQSILGKERINQLEHLNSIKIHNVSASGITILIEANAPGAFIQSEVR